MLTRSCFICKLLIFRTQKTSYFAILENSNLQSLPRIELIVRPPLAFLGAPFLLTFFEPQLGQLSGDDMDFMAGGF